MTNRTHLDPIHYSKTTMLESMKFQFILILCIACLVTGCSAPLVHQRNLNSPDNSQPHYMLPVPGSGVQVVELLSAGQTANNGYRMIGIPDGLGILDNGDDTFTLYMHHEINATDSRVRKHGAEGAFISQWTITKPNHPEGGWQMLAGHDAIEQVNLWNPDLQQYIQEPAALSRLCSADLAPVRAFRFPNTKLGTTERLLLGGEENDAFYDFRPYGRAFATVLTGSETGQTYELPRMGNMSFENVVARPLAHAKTVVIGLDDSASKTMNTLGEIYVYVGHKQSTGKAIQRAGLTNGKLYGLSVEQTPIEPFHQVSTHNWSRRFSLRQIDPIHFQDGRRLFELTKANNPLGITKFCRPEDGAWDPNNTNQFYFATTGIRWKPTEQNPHTTNVPGRIWRLNFDDADHPEHGGTIEVMLNGEEGVRHPDNIAFASNGHLLIQEDLGQSNELSRIWQFNPFTRSLNAVVEFNADYFTKEGDNYLTENEESSGIIDASDVLGPGWYLATVQSHMRIKDLSNFRNRNKLGLSWRDARELVEDGQLIALYVPMVTTTDEQPRGGINE